MKQLFTAVLLTISLMVSAQNGEKNFIDQNYIEVTGKAEMNIVPDLIYLKITLSDKDNKTKQSLEDIEKSMTTKFTELGIDITKDLAIKDYVSSYKTYWISPSDVVLTKEYQLIIHETKTLQKVYFELQNLGISNVTIDKLDNSNIEQYKKDVKVNAIKAAKDKAESLAFAINQAIGKAIFIQESDYNYLSSALQERVAGIPSNSISSFSNAASDSGIEFEKIKLHYSVLVIFELK